MQETSYRRVMTFEQLNFLSPQQLIDLMLRYNMHYKAIEITQAMGYEKALQQKILVHWACCKVEQTDKDDQQTYKEIVERLEKQSGVQYMDIAIRAVQVGRNELAQLIMEREISRAKRVNLYLWMASYAKQMLEALHYLEKAIAESVQSKDSQVIYFVLLRVFRLIENPALGVSKQDVFRVCAQLKSDAAQQQPSQQQSADGKNDVIVAHLVNYLLVYDLPGLHAYFQFEENFGQSSRFSIEQALVQDRIQFQADMYQNARAFLRKQTDKLYSDFMERELELLQKRATDLINSRNIDFIAERAPISFNRTLEQYYVAGSIRESCDSLRDKFQISKKRQLFQQLQDAIRKADQARIRDALAEMDKFNSKKNEVPYDLVAHLLQKAGLNELAGEQVLKMRDLDEQMALLLQLGCAAKILTLIRQKNLKPDEEVRRLTQLQ